MSKRTDKKVKIKIGQTWIDKKTGDIMYINARQGDYWQCSFERGRRAHKMTEFVLRRYYSIIDK